MSRFPSRPALLAVATSLALAGPAHATNGYFSHGYGMQSKGAAGVGAALPQDSLASATNPAGLTDLGDRLDLGLDYFVPDRGASITGNAFGPDQAFDGNDTRAFFIPEFGYVRQVNDRLAVGLAIYGNGGMNTDYGQNPYARFGATGEAGVNLSQLFVSPALAWKLNDRHSVGLAANLIYQEFEAKGVGLFAGFSSAPAQVSDKGKDRATGASVRLGWQGHFTDALTVGASWQSRGETGAFDDYRGLFADQGSFDVPETWVLGAAFKASKTLTLAADLQKIFYSDISAVGNSVASLFAGAPLGSGDGPGFGWQDIQVVKVAALYQATPRLLLRAGYSKSEQPVPAGETLFNILAPGVIEQHVTLGATWELDAKNALSVAYAKGLEERVNGAGSIPPGPPPGFGGGEANLHLSSESLGLAWQHKF